MPTIIQASGSALFSRLLLLGTGFGTSLLLPLLLDRTLVGQFFVAQLVIAGLSTTAQLGLTLAVPTLVTGAVAAEDFERARRTALAILTISLSAAGLTGMAILIASVPIANGFAGSHIEWQVLIPIIAIIVPFSSFSQVLIELLRATHRYRAAANITPLSAVFTLIYLIVVLTTQRVASLSAVLYAGLFGAIVCAVLGSAIFWRQVRDWPSSTSTISPIFEILQLALPNLFSTLVLFGLAQFDTFLLSYLSGPEEVAVYGIATRFSLLLLVPLSIANAALAPIVVELRTRGRTEDLRRVLGQAAWVCMTLALIPLVVITIFGRPLINLWNPEYQAAYILMLILGSAQVVHAACGTAGMFLMTNGDQLAVMRIAIITGFASVVFCIVGLKFAGTTGLATGAAIGNALQTVWFSFRVRSRFFVEPSVLGCILGHPTIPSSK